MRPRDVLQTIILLIRTKRPLFLWGPPGVGKTQIAHQAADQIHLQALTRRLSYEDPVDGRGLPSIVNGRTIWNRPQMLPLEGEGILFFDELPQAAPAMQQVGAQIALERRCGEHPLGDGWLVLVAGNRQEDRAGTYRIPTNVLSRFIHLDVDVSVEDWQAWAIAAGIDARIRSWIHFKPKYLHLFDASVHKRAFPTPRAYEFLNDVLPLTPPHLQLDVFAGTIGEGIAAEMLAYFQVCDGLPDLDHLLANPKTAAVPRDPSVLYALCGALAEKLRDKKAPLVAYAQYATRMPKEFAALALRDGGCVNRALISTKEVEYWCRDNKYLLNP